MNSINLFYLLQMFIDRACSVFVVPVYLARKDIGNAITGSPAELLQDFDRLFIHHDIDISEFCYHNGNLDIYIDCSSGSPLNGLNYYKATFTMQESTVSYPMKHRAYFFAPDDKTAHEIAHNLTETEKEKHGFYSLVYMYTEQIR